MRYALSAVVDVVATATELSPHHVNMQARRLQELGELARSPGGRLPALVNPPQVARLLLALLVDRPLVEAARLAAIMSDYRNQGMPVGDYIGRMLVSAGGPDFLAPASVLAAKASVTVHAGDAVVIRYTCTDDPLEEVFTASGATWAPDDAETIASARTLPGRLLHRIGRGLAGIQE
ncbi:hypothetical protein [Ancylobacter polymorphus]|uniref:Uncharacterized protein n=1 Tax=Ancylobacter polymorphus TaxID=223390 RepID=A0A9E6ZTL8_9HYPH|nr:hypothetical protein [Ancylobacter polymorphus]UOK70261.1 hypothetical protein K9D25_16215 [Ancylobacter polymorphus]